jgi:hypothetical protein
MENTASALRPEAPRCNKCDNEPTFVNAVLGRLGKRASVGGHFQQAGGPGSDELMVPDAGVAEGDEFPGTARRASHSAPSFSN